MCKVTGVNVTIEPKTVGIHQILNEIRLTVIVVLLGRNVDFWSCLPKYCVCTKVCQSNFGVDLNELFVCVCSLTVNLYLHSKHSLKMG